MKNKTLVLVGVLIMLIGIASFGYNKLKDSSTGSTTATSQESSDAKEDSQASEGDKATTENNSSDSSSKANAKKVAAPNFTVFDIDGNQVTLEEFKGRPMVINFWASWCKYCVQEMGDFQEVFDEFKDTDLKFVMINGTDGRMETREIATKYWNDNSFTMPIFFDEAMAGRDGLELNVSANAQYPIQGYPTTVFVDREGNIAGIAPGMLHGDQLKLLVEFIMDDANIGRPLTDALKK